MELTLGELGVFPAEATSRQCLPELAPAHVPPLSAAGKDAYRTSNALRNVNKNGIVQTFSRCYQVGNVLLLLNLWNNTYTKNLSTQVA